MRPGHSPSLSSSSIELVDGVATKGISGSSTEFGTKVMCFCDANGSPRVVDNAYTKDGQWFNDMRGASTETVGTHPVRRWRIYYIVERNFENWRRETLPYFLGMQMMRGTESAHLIVIE